MPSNETTQLKTRAIYDLSGGMVTNYSYTKFKINQVKLILNGDLTTDGSIVTRYGRSKVNSTAYGAYTISSMLALGQTSGADLILIGLSNPSTGLGVLKTSAGTTLRNLTDDESLMFAVMNDYGFCCNGVDTPFITDGTVANTYDLGIVTPPPHLAITAQDVTNPAAVSTGGWHWVFTRYRSTVTGARSVPNTPVAFPIGVIPFLIQQDSYRWQPIVLSTDPQVDVIDYFVTESICAIGDLVGTYDNQPAYYLGSTPNASGYVTWDVSDAELIVREVLDLDDLSAPVTLCDIENFKGRMVGITGDYTIRYSKKRVDQNGVVNLPTSWPATNELNVGWGDGDPLVKVIRFEDYLFAFKRRSVWLMLGDFDSNNFEFKQLKTNFTNVGLLNKRCVVQAGDSVYFVSDDLKMHRFRMTDFSTSELRLQDPPPSEKVANLFTSLASNYRQYVNMVNFTFSQYTQIWISFTDGSTGTVMNNNFSTFVFDYNADGGEGAWHIHTGHEVASSVLARAADLNYYIYTGDYQGYLWKHDNSLGDGASMNLTGGIVPAALNQLINADPVGNPFMATMDGCIIRCVSNTETSNVNQVRRGYFLDAATMLVVPDWPAAGTGSFTVGGIDFQIQSRDDWLDDSAPVDYDKQGWYLDLDITSEDLVTGGNPPINDLIINLYRDRTSYSTSVTKEFSYEGALWGTAIWGVDVWPEGLAYGIQVGMNLFFKQISHKIISQIAGQRLRVNGWTYHFQQLGKLRLR